jgi:hypothetical protein
LKRTSKPEKVDPGSSFANFSSCSRVGKRPADVNGGGCMISNVFRSLFISPLLNLHINFSIA